MPKLPELTPRKIEQILCSFGFVLERQKGSHCIYKNGNKLVVVPFHRTVKKGTLHAIIKASGIEVEDFLLK